MSLLLIYVFSYLYDGCLFHSESNPILSLFILQIVPASALGAPRGRCEVGVCVVLTSPHSVWCASSRLELQVVPGSSSIFSALALELITTLAPLTGEWCLEAKIWALGMLVATWVSVLLGLLSEHS